jgi:catechol 2,3-dioxygenase-like lactoylglutathione lyase family enzyme
MAAVFNHVGQCVADLERAKRFYVELFGFEVDREIAVPDAAVGSFLGVEPPVGLTVVYLRLGELQLELLAYDRPGNPEYRPRVLNEPGLTHVSLSVPDLDRVLDRVGDVGGSVVTQHRRSAFLRDPDGQLVEVIEREGRLGT